MDSGNKNRIELINDHIEKLKRQRTSIIARDSEKERKNRTRRLIQIGAIAIKYLQCPNDIEPEYFEKVIKFFIRGAERE